MRYSKIIRLSELARLSGVGYHKIFFRQNGLVKSDLTLQDKTKIINTINAELKNLYEEFGFEVKINQKATR